MIRLTHNSLATTIGFVATFLLGSGVSTLFSESVRTMWLMWGSFGLAAAVGLDVAARFRERMWIDELKLVTTSRFARNMKYETDDKEANAAIREAVARIIGRTPPVLQIATSRHTQGRYLCDLDVELLLDQGFKRAAGNDGTCTRHARVTNLSESGFELMLTEPLPHRRMEMIITAANGGRQTMFGEVLWYGPQGVKSIVAGGRFLDAVSVEGDGNASPPT